MKTLRPRRTKTVKGLPAILAFTFWAAGIIGGVYVGIWVMLIGGIEQVVDGFNAQPHDSGKIAWGLARTILFETGGGLVFFLLFGLGSLIIIVLGD